MRGNKIKPSDIIKMVKLRKAGVIFRKIAEKFKVDKSTIIYHLKQFKIELVKPKSKPYPKKQKPYPKPQGKTHKTYQERLQEERDKTDPIVKARGTQKGI